MLSSVRSMERFAGSCKLRWNLQKLRRNLQNLTPFAPKIAEISLDLFKSRWISLNMVEISPKSTWIFSNLTGSHQIWLRSHWNQLESPRISQNLTKYGCYLVGSSQIWAWSCRSCLALYISSGGLGDSGFREENCHSTHLRWVLGVKTHHQPTGASVRVEFGWGSGRFFGLTGLSQVWTPLLLMIIFPPNF